MHTIFACVGTCVAVLASVGHPSKSARQRSGLVRAHGISGEGALRPGTYTAPDGRYLVRLAVGQAERAHLTVLRVNRGRHTLVRRIEDVEDFMWLPGRRHTIVFSTCNAYADEAILALWRGYGIRKLKRPTHRGNDECYWIHAATQDGRVLIYSHASLSPWTDSRTRDRAWSRQMGHRRRLVLPTP
jgi:hypothetical protein